MKAVENPLRNNSGASDEDSLNELMNDVNRLVGSMGDTIDIGLSMAAVEEAGQQSLRQVCNH